MATRTVRLDAGAEKTLARLRAKSGLSVTDVLKRGLAAYAENERRAREPSAYAIYQRLDLGRGGWAIAPASDVKRAVKDAIRRKHGR